MFEDLVLTPVQPDTTLPSPEKASDQAFYAAGSYSNDPITSYNGIKQDLISTGYSQELEDAKVRWSSEHDNQTKAALTDFISDPSVDNSIKKAALQTYSISGYAVPDLKQKYIQNIATQDNSVTLVDRQSQDHIVDNIQTRMNELEKEQHKSYITKGSETISDIAQGVSGIATSFLASIPAGWGGLFSLIQGENPEVADRVRANIQQDLTYSPKGDKAKIIQENISKGLDWLNKPGEWIGDKILEYTGSPGAATTGRILLDPLNYIPLGVASKIAKRAIRSDSPIKVTEAANPELAINLETAALNDSSGAVADALGTSQAQIVQESVLPKIPSEVIGGNVDLSKAISKADKSFINTAQVTRYDPSIVNADEKLADYDIVVKTLNEIRSPTYQQSNSIVIPPAGGFSNVWEGRSVFGRTSAEGWLKESAAQNALEKIQEHISTLPEALQGKVELKKEGSMYYVHWNWKKEYDPLDIPMGFDINTSILGNDVSNLARTKLGNWLFSHGRFPKWFEDSPAIGIEKGNLLANEMLDSAKKMVSTTRNPKELLNLINEGESLGKEWYTKEDIQTKFPYLSSNRVEGLLESHVAWRRQAHYQYYIISARARKDMVDAGLSGIYDKSGNYIGAGKYADDFSKIAEIWDLDDNKPTAFDPTIEMTGGKVIKLHEKINSGNRVYEYAQIHGNHTLDILPSEVLPRIPGWSPRRHDEHFFVRGYPKELYVNGNLIKDSTILEKDHTKALAAARTKYEADRLVEEFVDKYPDINIKASRAREDDFGRVLSEYQVNADLFTHSRKRGEILESGSGPARIEDRLLTLFNTTQRLARSNAFSAWEEATQKQFVKTYSKFLNMDENGGKSFPQYITDIHSRPNMSDVERTEYQTALRAFEKYASIKTLTYKVDNSWKNALHYVADTIESFKLPAPILRDWAKNEIPVVKGLKQLATMRAISLNPLRQWIVQPQQIWELSMISPKTGLKNLELLSAIKFLDMSEAPMLSKLKPAMTYMASKGAPISEKELVETLKAIKESGILQAVDLNATVHGVFSDAERPLGESAITSALKAPARAISTLSRAGRAFGFDPAERSNRIFTWLQVRDWWIDKNPGKDWKSQEAKFAIQAESLRQTGMMNKAGNLPYQNGMLSPFFQFSAIGQKQLNNLLIDQATSLSNSQRIKLAAARFAMLGAKYGIPGGLLYYNYVKDPESAATLPDWKYIRDRGMADFFTNKLIGAHIDPEHPSDILLSRSLTSYDENFHPLVSFAVELSKIFDKQDPSNPRFPAIQQISSFGDALNTINAWHTTKDITPESSARMMEEAASFLSSGISNATKAHYLMAEGALVNKNGHIQMENLSHLEHMALVFGVQSGKPEEQYQAAKILINDRQTTNDMVEDFYSLIRRQQIKEGTIEDFNDFSSRLSSFITIMREGDLSERQMNDVITGVIDKMGKERDMKYNLMFQALKYHADKGDTNMQKFIATLGTSEDPEIKELYKTLTEEQK